MNKKDALIDIYTVGESNLVKYRRIFFPPGKDEVEPAKFHYDWSDKLLNGKQHTAIEGFRESAKTQYVLRAFPSYVITYPDRSRNYIVLIKKNTQLARNKLHEIEREVKSNPLIQERIIRIEEESGDVFSITVRDDAGDEMNVRIEAYGKGASVRGIAYQDRRPQIIIVDDPQDKKELKLNSTVSDTDWNWFLADVMFLGKNARIFLIGNNLGERCIVERIFADEALAKKEGRPSLGFDCSKVRVLDDDDNPSWPSRDSKADILVEKEKFRGLGKLDIWMMEKMCEAVAEESKIFKAEYFQYFNPALKKKIRSESNCYLTLDPATSKDRSSCYRAMVINCVTPDNLWFIVDVPYGRWDPVTTMDTLFDKVVQWELRDVHIEKGMYQQILEPFLAQEMKKRNVFFNVELIEHAKEGSKLERIKMLQPRFKTHSILFPDSDYWVAEMESELGGVKRDEIKSLYIDLADALAMQLQCAKPPYGKQKLSNLPRQAQT